MNINIIFEDEDLLIVDKPAGMTVNKADTTKGEVTVQEWAEDRIGIKNSSLAIASSSAKATADKSAGKQESLLRPDFAKATSGKQGFGGQARIKENGVLKKDENSKWDPVKDFYNRGGVVHRLDKETSGILILAKNPEAFSELQRQFKERIVEKKYIALAHGKIVPSEGEISVPVGRLPWNRMQFGVVPGGRESKTNYNLVSIFHFPFSNEQMSLLELKPETGRTHQIRVHLKYLGYPIFGDYLYAGRKTAKKDRKVLGRVFLHAAKISFLHPKSGERVEFESKLPPELDNVLKQLIRA